MKKLIAAALLLASNLAMAEDSSIEVSWYLQSSHFSGGYLDGSDEKLSHNEKGHNLLGIEYRTGDYGMAISKFKNSFRRDSVMIDAVKYWELAPNIEASIRGGLVTGYDDYDFCPINGAKLCPIVSVGIAYTKYDFIVPKLSMIAGAYTFSLSTRF